MLWEKLREHSIRARNYSVHRYAILIPVHKFTENHKAEEEDGEEEKSKGEGLRKFNENLSNLKLKMVLNCLTQSVSPCCLCCELQSVVMMLWFRWTSLYRPAVSFFRALVQPEYSAVTDVYVLMFLADTVDFIIIVFGFWAFGVKLIPLMMDN